MLVAEPSGAHHKPQRRACRQARHQQEQRQRTSPRFSSHGSPAHASAGAPSGGGFMAVVDIGDLRVVMDDFSVTVGVLVSAVNARLVGGRGGRRCGRVRGRVRRRAGGDRVGGRCVGRPTPWWLRSRWRWLRVRWLVQRAPPLDAEDLDRALGRHGRGAQRREGPHPRDGAHGHGARRSDPRDGDPAAEAVRHLAGAFERLTGDGDATALADAAIEGQRRVGHAYRTAMSALLQVADLPEVLVAVGCTAGCRASATSSTPSPNGSGTPSPKRRKASHPATTAPVLSVAVVSTISAAPVPGGVYRPAAAG